MDINIHMSWGRCLEEEFQKSYFKELADYLDSEYSTKSIFPPKNDVFNAFNLTPLDNVKVVILGQDPYHQPNQAHGLSFSVNDGVKIPPSLKNIFKELHSDIGVEIPSSGSLVRWAQQGVLLLNATLTVEASRAGAHQKKGWEIFTDRVISVINEHCKGIVFMLWGSYAHKKGDIIDENRHLVLRSVHPSPLSAYGGFFGCKHFSKCNDFLTSEGKKPINW